MPNFNYNYDYTYFFVSLREPYLRFIDFVLQIAISIRYFVLDVPEIEPQIFHRYQPVRQQHLDDVWVLRDETLELPQLDIIIFVGIIFIHDFIGHEISFRYRALAPTRHRIQRCQHSLDQDDQLILRHGAILIEIVQPKNETAFFLTYN